MLVLNTKNITKKEGYTIIETMIAISLFLVIIMFGMGALLNANIVHKKSQDMRSIIDNLSFIMEDMSRSIRTGYDFQCYQKISQTTISSATVSDTGEIPRSCSDGWALAFEPSTGSTADFNDQWMYYITESVINGNTVGHIWKSTNGDPNSAIQLTPNDIDIDPVSGFSVLGAEGPSSGDSQQPFIIMKLVGTITYKGVVTPFNLQTSMSQRLIDIEP